jgi:hypothetical protein
MPVVLVWTISTAQVRLLLVVFVWKITTVQERSPLAMLVRRICTILEVLLLVVLMGSSTALTGLSLVLWIPRVILMRLQTMLMLKPASGLSLQQGPMDLACRSRLSIPLLEHLSIDD